MGATGLGRPTGAGTSDEASPCEDASGETGTRQTSAGQTSAGQTSAGQTSAGQAQAQDSRAGCVGGIVSNTRTPKFGNGIGFGFGTILFFIFLVLKLTGFIAWSW